ncbi:hypothetical protein, partial [Nitrosococcus oceani]|uniref:hypothetical protein n=1 Tax=Nitrosococcus oceani TaxID=1229 RepID=UPI001E4DA7F8
HCIQIGGGGESGAEAGYESDDFMSFHPNLLVLFVRISRIESAVGYKSWASFVSLTYFSNS